MQFSGRPPRSGGRCLTAITSRSRAAAFPNPIFVGAGQNPIGVDTLEVIIRASRGACQVRLLKRVFEIELKIIAAILET